MFTECIIQDTDSALLFNQLTFRTYRNHLETISINENIIAIGASVQSQPVALILVEINEHRLAKILSIFVKPAYRNQGIGTSLLARLEHQLHLKECQSVKVVYITDEQNTIALESLLSKFHWTKPTSRMLVCKTNIYRVAQAPWMKLSKLPSAYEILPWVKITSKERIALQKQENNWIAKDANPFNHETDLEPLNSLGLRYKGQVVGWMICHRLSEDTIRYTCGYVRPDLQKMGRFIPLLVRAIRLQTEAKIPRGTWTTAFFHASFADFVQKHMQPYLDSLEQSKESYKLLSPQKLSDSNQINIFQTQ